MAGAQPYGMRLLLVSVVSAQPVKAAGLGALGHGMTRPQQPTETEPEGSGWLCLTARGHLLMLGASCLSSSLQGLCVVGVRGWDGFARGPIQPMQPCDRLPRFLLGVCSIRD